MSCVLEASTAKVMSPKPNRAVVTQRSRAPMFDGVFVDVSMAKVIPHFSRGASEKCHPVGTAWNPFRGKTAIPGDPVSPVIIVADALAFRKLRCKNAPAHQLLGTAIIHPDQRAVIPLIPELIVNCDGVAKNDCD